MIDTGIVTAVVMGISEGAKKMGVNPKFIPVVNLALGIVGGCVYLSPSNLKEGILAGIIVGLSASGLYSGVKNVVSGMKKEQ